MIATDAAFLRVVSPTAPASSPASSSARAPVEPARDPAEDFTAAMETDEPAPRSPAKPPARAAHPPARHADTATQAPAGDAAAADAAPGAAKTTDGTPAAITPGEAALPEAATDAPEDRPAVDPAQAPQPSAVALPVLPTLQPPPAAPAAAAVIPGAEAVIATAASSARQVPAGPPLAAAAAPASDKAPATAPAGSADEASDEALLSLAGDRDTGKATPATGAVPTGAKSTTTAGAGAQPAALAAGQPAPALQAAQGMGTPPAAAPEAGAALEAAGPAGDAGKPPAKTVRNGTAADLAPLADATTGQQPAVTDASAGLLRVTDAAGPAWSLSAHATTHAQTAATQAAHAGILQQIGIALSGRDSDTIELRLDPPELGRLQIHLRTDDTGGLQAMVLSDRPETSDFLRRHAADLSRELKDAGFGQVSLDFSTGGDRPTQNGFAQAAESRALAREAWGAGDGAIAPAGPPERAAPEKHPSDTGLSGLDIRL